MGASLRSWRTIRTGSGRGAFADSEAALVATVEQAPQRVRIYAVALAHRCHRHHAIRGKLALIGLPLLAGLGLLLLVFAAALLLALLLIAQRLLVVLVRLVLAVDIGDSAD